MVIVRWVTDRRAVTFSSSEARRKQWGGTRIGKTKTPYVLGVLVLPMRVGDPVVGLRRRNRLVIPHKS
ncbi:MAG: hypothetical protein LBQ66_12530 [Planctomycetaceae bacterium]|nr:hypothetical protein [Planctomycetaceae bacterium]